MQIIQGVTQTALTGKLSALFNRISISEWLLQKKHAYVFVQKKFLMEKQPLTDMSSHKIFRMMIIMQHRWQQLWAFQT